MKDPTGKQAPAGGFQNLGWYNGYQYYNGSFAPQAGMIHPNSPQQGSGQAVSQEVNKQTSVQAGLTPNANQDYVNALNAKPVVNPQVTTKQTATTGAMGAGTGAGIGLGAGITAPATINLPNLYTSLYASSGISDLEKQYSDMEKSFIETKGKINDNPFLSEATRVGRVAKLEQLFNERTANIKNDIATKKADIETKINLETKQFDINSQVAKNALDQFNTLLSMGALDNASGEDIASLTRMTGLSSQAIQSAVNANKQKNVKTQVITSTADDGTVTAVVINTETGEIIAKNDLGRVGNAENKGSSGSDFTDTQERSIKASAVKALQVADDLNNPDKLLSLDEYKKALENLVAETGIEVNQADNYLTSQMQTLGYKKWKW